MMTIYWVAVTLYLSPAPLHAQAVDCSIPSLTTQFNDCMEDPESRAAYLADPQRRAAYEASHHGPHPAAESSDDAKQWDAEFKEYYKQYDLVSPLLWGQAGVHPGWENPGTCEKLTKPGSAMQSVGLKIKINPVLSDLAKMNVLRRQNEQLIADIVQTRNKSCSGTLADSSLNPTNWKAPFCPWLKNMLCGDGKRSSDLKDQQKSSGLKDHWPHIKRAMLNAGKCATGMGEDLNKLPPSAWIDENPPKTDCPE
jgi:hypothetical protein